MPLVGPLAAEEAEARLLPAMCHVHMQSKRPHETFLRTFAVPIPHFYSTLQGTTVALH